MPRPRFAKADAQLQRRILDAATQEFTLKEYESASLNRILLSAGLSKGSFYYYFDDKADLAAAVLAQLFEELEPLLEELGKPKDVKGFWAAFRRYIDRTLDEGFGTQQRLDLVGKLGMAIIDHPEVMALMEPRIIGFRQRLAAFFQQGQRLGAVRKDLSAEAIMAVMQAVKTALARTLLPRRSPTRAQLDAFNEVLWEMTVRLSKP